MAGPGLRSPRTRLKTRRKRWQRSRLKLRRKVWMLKVCLRSWRRMRRMTCY